MAELIVSLQISAEEYLKLYQGSARAVYTRTRDGRSIRFPANILQRFVTREGVRGTFAIYFDGNNKFQKIEQLNSGDSRKG